MKKSKSFFIVINLILLLGYFNYSVAKKENILRDGQLILLELAAADPRSLMQGDYMQLRYKITSEANMDSLGRRGYCVVRLEDDPVAKLVRFQSQKSPLSSGEHLIAYTNPDKWQIDIGAESFFFQEGQAKKYATAKYGGIKVDKSGNSILVGLYDDHLKEIE